jgi:hypothetical protein
MDIESAQPRSEGSSPRALSSQANDRKELAWAFFGLILWSAVVFGGLYELGHVLGHVLFDWW